MKKTYKTPAADVISLIADEYIVTSGNPDAEPGYEGGSLITDG